MKKKVKPVVGIIMGSDSDLEIMAQAAEVLENFSVPVEVTVVSAHRTPDRLFDYCKNADRRGLRVIIAGAGGAAHLPGMAASLSPLPVIGVPIKSKNSIEGMDSLLSIVQMPPGVPVATVGVNGGKNAGILAAQILSSGAPKLLTKIKAMKSDLMSEVYSKVEKMESLGFRAYSKFKQS